MPPISVLMKPASGLCNMQCDYCFYCDEIQKRKQQSYGFMSEETLKNIIRKTMFHAEGTVSYAYQGGEPTLRGIEFFKKALEFQKKYNRKGIKVYNVLQTNGYAIDEQWCRFFAENDFLIGVSVDGTEEIHNTYRHDQKGNDTYHRVIRATELMDAYKVEYNILTVVNRKVAKNIEEIYREYKRRRWEYQQYIPCLDPLDEGHEQKEYSLSPEEYGRFLTGLFDLWYRDWKRNRQPYIRQFDNYIAILLGYLPEACDQRGTCGIQYVVEADGSVYPCDFYMLDEYRLGNFNQDRLIQLDEKRRKIEFIERSLLLDEKCRKCRFYAVCRGGCQRHRDSVEGETYYRNYFCQGFQMFFENCGERLMEIAESMRT